MGRKGWATAEQHVFLEQHIHEFITSQNSSTTADFFDAVFEVFKGVFVLTPLMTKQLDAIKPVMENGEVKRMALEEIWFKVGVEKNSTAFHTPY